MDGKFDLIPLFINAGIVVKGVLLVLLLSSLYSWAIILRKRKEISSLKDESNHFLNFYRSSVNLSDIFQKSKEMPFSPYQIVFQKGYEEFIKIRDSLGKTGGREVLQEHFAIYGLNSIERSLSRAINECEERLESSLDHLASIGSLTPFIGLLGTVWGIIDAFIGLGMQGGKGGLDSVAPGIAEALVTTAVGLFTAIPAVFFYNYFSSKANSLLNQTESYSKEFINMLERIISKPTQTSSPSPTQNQGK